MAALSYRTVLNRVLEILGEEQLEDSAPALTSDYHKMVGGFINIIKDEIEAAHNWRALITEGSAIVEVDAETATVDGVTGEARLFRMQDQRSQRLVPLVFDTTDATNPLPLTEISLSEMMYRRHSDNGTSHNGISYFTLSPFATDSSVMVLHVWPKQSVERTVSMIMVQPEPYLPTTGVSTLIAIPTRPLILGAVWFALQERGEELGIGSVYTEERFRQALDDAISQDNADQGDISLLAT